MNKAQAIDKIIKLRALAKDPGSVAEAGSAARVAERMRQRFDVDEHEIRERMELLQAISDVGDEVDAYQYDDRTYSPRLRPSVEAALDHKRLPFRVHMAVTDMRAVCGVGPTFVWTFTRSIAIASGVPCPHCMDTGVIDARRPTLRIASGRPMPARA